ncbi:proximal sequence element A Pbp95 isoform X2 [Ptiloglossa arizonensis]|uniref:proximal sequence element A Pbp95 isoform X2 n=1 Tax=Ptiloglossa arizonensis TaxID=3350558 RepID=UPI003F9F74C3
MKMKIILNVLLELKKSYRQVTWRYLSKIISFLLDLKKHITYALQKCEKKLTVVETNLRKHTVGDAKILICNAGIPYFKDRNYFFAPNNDDETLKESHKELQVRNLPKVTPWTTKERDTLLKAIQEEAATNVLHSQKIERSRINDPTFKLMSKSKEKKMATKKFPPTDFIDMVGPLGNREFDWFKISSIHFEDIHSPLDCRVMWNVFLHPEINKNYWTKPEDIKLKEIAKKHKFQNWDKIAKELNTNRTAYQCFIRYNTTKKLPKVRNCIWENGEDERLLKLVDIFKMGDFIPWGEVASWMQNRTKQQAYFRWTYSLAPYLTKGRFSKSEDNVLKDAVIKYGPNFRKISAALMPNRSTVQLNYRYQILTTNEIQNWNVWTLAEDSKLLELFDHFGPNWSKISEAFSCKTRTRLRHRHAALQKYIKKGISIVDLHKNHLKDKNERPQEEKKEESLQKNSSSLDRDCNNDVDQELIEYFHMKQATTNSIHKRKPYTAEELKSNAKNLYNTLQLLNAKLNIPDDINNLKLNDRERQLLCSLKEYARMKDDEKRHFEVIDKCSSLMFGTSCDTEEGTHYVPPPPFDSQIKLKKSKETQCIDYHLNTKNAFLVVKPIDFDTPDFVISHIGGNEQELQFQKLSHSFEITSSKSKQATYNIQKFCTFPTGISLQQNNSNSTSNSNNRNNLSDNMSQETKSIICYKSVSGTTFESNSTRDHNCVKLKNENHMEPREKTTKNATLFSTFEKIQHYASTSSIETTGGPEIPSIEATHATLFCFKNLMYLKQLNETCSSSYQFFMKSKRFQDSFNLLETRLEQLFKYPIGQSKTLLPEVYVMDAFSYDNVAPKRKASEMSKILKTYKIKKLRSFNKNSKNLTR